MARKFDTNLDMQLNQALNLVLQQLASDPSQTAGQLYYNTATSTLHFGNGTSWIQLGTLDQISAAAASVNLNNQRITSLANPVNGQDAVNLQTLQSYLASLSDRDEVQYATAAALPANAYNNGSSGVGATLTASSNGTLSIDGVAVAAGQRVLVQNEATQANNGIYTVTNAGSGSAQYVLTRSADFNTSGNMGPGVLVPVKATGTAGATNDGKVFLSASSLPFTPGTTAISFSQVGSTYSADGATIQLSGTVFSLVTPVTVGNGGTGATNAGGARSNLGATGKYAATIGDGSTTTFTVTHNLNTTDVHAAIYNIGSGLQEECDVANSNVNSVTLTFSAAPSSNNIRVVVIG